MSNPFDCRICRDVDPNEVVEPDDDEGMEQVETDSWNNDAAAPCRSAVALLMDATSRERACATRP